MGVGVRQADRQAGRDRKRRKETRDKARAEWANRMPEK